MKPTKILLASVFITAFILVIVGGVSKVAFGSTTQTDAQTIQEYQQREAAYQKLIDEANQRLQKANEQMQAAQNQQVQQNTPAVNNSPAPQVAVSADEAQQAALKVVDPGSQVLKTPDLVNFQGKTAYEVAFEKGSVYISANDGSVLFNGTVPQTITADKAAQVASDYLKIKGISQVDKITFRGQELYRVIFTNGTMAYLDLTGQILFVNHPGLLASADNSAPSNGGGGGGGGSHYEDHEGHDD